MSSVQLSVSSKQLSIISKQLSVISKQVLDAFLINHSTIQPFNNQHFNNPAIQQSNNIIAPG